MHSRARYRLVQVHQFLTFLEAHEEDGHRPDVQPMRTQPHEVIEHTSDLIEHYADVLRALGRGDAEQLLDREHVSMLVAHHRYIVEPVHVTDRLVERLRLRELLRSPMQQADVWIRFLDG